MIYEEITEFGKRLGFSGLALDASARVSIHIGTVGALTLELDDDQQLLVMLSKGIEAYENAKYLEVLRQINWRHALPVPIRAGFYRQQLILLVKINGDQVTAALLENVLRELMNQMAKV